MMHEYHDKLPGFDAAQIFHDGCGECERRGADIELALAHMDTEVFRRAWFRAREFDAGRVTNVSHAEVSALRVLAAIRNRITSDRLVAATICAPTHSLGRIPTY